MCFKKFILSQGKHQQIAKLSHSLARLIMKDYLVAIRINWAKKM